MISRSGADRTFSKNVLRPTQAKAVRLSPTYKIISKETGDRDKSMSFKTRNPRARARIKRIMARWEKK